MHISDFEMLRRMAAEIDRLQERVTDLTETAKTGVYHHFTLFKASGGFGGLGSLEHYGCLFDEGDVPTATKALFECRDRCQARLDELRKKFVHALADYKPGDRAM